MKIALCLSGERRAFRTAFKYWYENLISLYDIDLFIHTWDVQGVEVRRDYKSEGSMDDYIDLYQPVKAVKDIYNSHTKNEIRRAHRINEFIEDIRNGKIDTSQIPKSDKYTKCHICGLPYSAKQWVCFACGGKQIDNVLAQWHTTTLAMGYKTVHELGNARKYDVIIRSRPDVILLQKIRLPLLELASVEELIMPLNRFHIKFRNSPQDYFIVGNHSVMDVYHSLLLDPNRLFRENFSYCGENRGSHAFLPVMLHKHNIGYVEPPLEFNLFHKMS